MTNESLQSLEARLSVIASKPRLEIIRLLRELPLTAVQLADKLQTSPSFITYHLDILERVGLIGGTKIARHRTFFVHEEIISELLVQIGELLKKEETI